MTPAPTKLHQLFVAAENERDEAAKELNRLVKLQAEAYQRYDAARRLAKKLKERLRKKLQKDDR